MKNLLSTLFVLLFIVTVSAQENGMKKANLTADQIAELQTKKMELHLDLTKEQRQKVYEINKKNATARKEQMATRKGLKESNKQLSADEKYAIKSNRLDSKIAQKKEMSSVLTPKQMEKLQTMNAKKSSHKGSCSGKKTTSCAGKKPASCTGAAKSKKDCCPSKK